MYSPHFSISQTVQVNRIDPANWWVGMKGNTVQLILYRSNGGENFEAIYRIAATLP